MCEALRSSLAPNKSKRHSNQTDCRGDSRVRGGDRLRAATPCFLAQWGWGCGLPQLVRFSRDAEPPRQLSRAAPFMLTQVLSVPLCTMQAWTGDLLHSWLEREPRAAGVPAPPAWQGGGLPGRLARMPYARRAVRGEEGARRRGAHHAGTRHSPPPQIYAPLGSLSFPGSLESPPTAGETCGLRAVTLPPGGTRSS